MGVRVGLPVVPGRGEDGPARLGSMVWGKDAIGASNGSTDVIGQGDGGPGPRAPSRNSRIRGQACGSVRGDTDIKCPDSGDSRANRTPVSGVRAPVTGVQGPESGTADYVTSYAGLGV